MKNKNKKFNWVFFGTPIIAVHFLDSLEPEFYPSLIVTKPDAKVGRKQIITPPAVKIWAQEKQIPVIQYKNLKDQDKVSEELSGFDFFFVFAYGKILPEWLINLPTHNTLNFHPSLLPHYRGPSPIASMILDDQKETGVSLMLIDKKMDHGAIIVQEKILINEWQKFHIHEKNFAKHGAHLFQNNIGSFLKKEITPVEQNHDDATYCGFYEKSDMEIKQTFSERQKYLTYCAFSKPFMYENKRRIIITEAEYNNNKFEILRVIPEGQSEQNYQKTC